MASSNQAASTRTQARNNTQAIVVTAMCIALTYIFTAVVNIRLPFAPNGGLIHLGNVIFCFWIINEIIMTRLYCLS